jgi:ADP-heptose:LPS heptosyltransferase
MPLQKMISIGNKIKSPIILLGGKEDAVISQKLKSSLKGNVIDGCGNYSLNQSAAILKHAKLVITHDTGLMHIASAFRKKIISVWGNTVPEFGMYPYLPSALKANSTILEVKNLRCRPCSKIGFDKCPKGHFKCMNEIDEGAFVGV